MAPGVVVGVDAETGGVLNGSINGGLRSDGLVDGGYPSSQAELPSVMLVKLLSV